MKFSTLSLAAIFLLGGNLALSAKSKTTTPKKILPEQLAEDPYRYNGAVRVPNYRGSGFCAWNSKTFFTAAHVVYGTQWAEPPIWYPRANSAVLVEKTAIPTRGYYRWTNFATLLPPITVDNPEPTNFGYDVALAFAFEKLIKGKPATLNLNGSNDLRKKSKTLITGYPAKNAYLDEDIKGYFLHKTGPLVTTYEKHAGKSLITTLVTTGGGNSGGPIWTPNSKSKSKWNAAGVLVGGLPSESVIYPFSSDTNSFLRAVAPVLQPEIGQPVKVGGISSFSTFFPYNQRTKIPDGRRQWTSFRIPVGTFTPGSKVKSVSLSLTILTPHVGDLQVMLEGPQGLQTDLRQVLIWNEKGAGDDNLVLSREDVSARFTDMDPTGNWYLRVQDRLVGDTATLKSILLEIATEDVLTPTTP
jgi:subtilisin-like proprotein convertase family protein